MTDPATIQAHKVGGAGWPIMNIRVGIIVIMAGLLSGCFSPDPKSLSSDSPPSAIPAIKTAADTNDRSAIPRLVQDLSSDDSAMRFAAIQALRQMTGKDFGYQYYYTEAQRRPAVKQWQQWLKEHSSP